ncbi:ECF transporter S component [Melissococcus plutonius]|uniref:Substrate-specific component PanT of predicted pantothenate ECF transporter n=2 Tax=Melissococcus plutonius TaxID=33970 RepID=F3YC01_MELPT|nr:ECF transporter S component [Melissococcus plutonius]BAL61722.1 ECF transporter substrate-specific protein PanT [Melissococcus plutonius DAT561]AIM25293.1 pantothenic acid transporter PanT [Melissococcus plutonius S1]KMT23978.1 pantothenic acid transporter PanT [Melissococcus plutonius]KMT24501.1 pantothenic acid transporter PanT [Melissococcus plutonius]KMT26074.1 pantothenic acid transporter PanT [Melissococcus plutonius]
MRKTQKFTLTALFLAILILLAITPLGFIPLGVINPTTMHIPVIIASIILGPKIGGMLGGTFGLISMIRATITPSPTSFVLSPFIPVIGTNHGSLKALLIVFIPRILIGVVPYFIYRWLSKLFKNKKQSISLFIAGIAGSLTNTILVMNMIYFLFADTYAQAVGKGGNVIYWTIIGTIVTSGIPEALIAGMITSAVCLILFRIMKPTAYNQL